MKVSDKSWWYPQFSSMFFSDFPFDKGIQLLGYPHEKIGYG